MYNLHHALDVAAIWPEGNHTDSITTLHIRIYTHSKLLLEML